MPVLTMRAESARSRQEGAKVARKKQPRRCQQGGVHQSSISADNGRRPTCSHAPHANVMPGTSPWVRHTDTSNATIRSARCPCSRLWVDRRKHEERLAHVKTKSTTCCYVFMLRHSTSAEKVILTR